MDFNDIYEGDKGKVRDCMKEEEDKERNIKEDDMTDVRSRMKRGERVKGRRKER